MRRRDVVAVTDVFIDVGEFEEEKNKENVGSKLELIGGEHIII